MCGLTGAINVDIEDNQLNLILAKLNHRGPDDKGYFFSKDNNSSIFFVHNRLEILDISNGKQPMISKDGRYSLVYNGEIYNFIELRKKLKNLGYKFITDHSDTEVLIHGFIEWGKKLPEFLNGMWSFAIYDKKKNNLFMSRDRFGEKPSFIFLMEVNLFFHQSFLELLNLKTLILILIY